MITNCETKLSLISSWTIAKLPLSASKKLPSRGMVFVGGTINDTPFQAPLEPDGKGSHWLHIEKSQLKKIHAKSGDTVTLAIEPLTEWPEPEIPSDINNALTTNTKAYEMWLDTTTMARWDWIRWIRSTKNPETRKKRIEVALSKLKAGSKRPCCFNRSACTEPSVSNGGVLIEPK